MDDRAPHGIEPRYFPRQRLEPSFKTDYRIHFAISALLLGVAANIETWSGAVPEGLALAGASVFVIAVRTWVIAHDEVPNGAF